MGTAGGETSWASEGAAPHPAPLHPFPRWHGAQWGGREGGDPSSGDRGDIPAARGDAAQGERADLPSVPRGLGQEPETQGQRQREAPTGSPETERPGSRPHEAKRKRKVETTKEISLLSQRLRTWVASRNPGQEARPRGAPPQVGRRGDAQQVLRATSAARHTAWPAGWPGESRTSSPRPPRPGVPSGPCPHPHPASWPGVGPRARCSPKHASHTRLRGGGTSGACLRPGWRNTARRTLRVALVWA